MSPPVAGTSADKGKSDLVVQVFLNSVEARFGGERKIWIKRFELCTGCDARPMLKACRRCRGKGGQLRQRTLQARIPSGVRHGTRVRLRGAGHRRVDRSACDVIVVVNVSHTKKYSVAEPWQRLAMDTLAILSKTHRVQEPKLEFTKLEHIPRSTWKRLEPEWWRLRGYYEGGRSRRTIHLIDQHLYQAQHTVCHEFQHYLDDLTIHRLEHGEAFEQRLRATALKALGKSIMF